MAQHVCCCFCLWVEQESIFIETNCVGCSHTCLVNKLPLLLRINGMNGAASSNWSNRNHMFLNEYFQDQNTLRCHSNLADAAASSLHFAHELCAPGKLPLSERAVHCLSEQIPVQMGVEDFHFICRDHAEIGRSKNLHTRLKLCTMSSVSCEWMQNQEPAAVPKSDVFL